MRGPAATLAVAGRQRAPGRPQHAETRLAAPRARHLRPDSLSPPSGCSGTAASGGPARSHAGDRLGGRDHAAARTDHAVRRRSLRRGWRQRKMRRRLGRGDLHQDAKLLTFFEEYTMAATIRVLLLKGTSGPRFEHEILCHKCGAGHVFMS